MSWRLGMWTLGDAAQSTNHVDMIGELIVLEAKVPPSSVTYRKRVNVAFACPRFKVYWQ